MLNAKLMETRDLLLQIAETADDCKCHKIL